MNTMNIRISKGNRKMTIPSFSLPSGKTCSCEACKTCYAHGCYARKMERIYSSVRTSYQTNLDLVNADMTAVENELNAYFDALNSPKMFRIHVSGDFFSDAYYMMWIRVIKNHPNTKFLAFTKQMSIIRPHLKDIPDNLSLVWSSWPGVPIVKDIRDALPIAWMQDGTENRVPEDAIPCQGNCDTCGRCWGLDGHDVVFNKH